MWLEHLKNAGRCAKGMNLPPESIVTTIGSAPEDGVKVNSISPSSAPLMTLLMPAMVM